MVGQLDARRSAWRQDGGIAARSRAGRSAAPVSVTIDATFCRGGLRFTGTGTYVFKLMQYLARLNDGNSYTVIASDEQELPDEVREAGWRVEKVRWPKMGKFSTLLFQQYRLPMLLGKVRPAVFHAPGLFGWPALPAVPLRLPKSCRLVVTVHDLIPLTYYDRRLPAFRSRQARLFYRVMLRRVRSAAHICAVSRHTRTELVDELGIDPRRISVIPNGVEAGAAADVRGLPREYLLYVGSFEPRKNLDGLLLAYKRLLDNKATDMPLVLAGPVDSDFAPGVVERADQLSLGQSVVFLDSPTPAELTTVYARAALFVFPSFSEGFGLPPLEAMAQGTPVVCSNAAALPEVVGEAALLVDPADAAGIADAIEAVLTDGRLREKLAVAGHERVKSFSWSETARLTAEAYRRAVE